MRALFLSISIVLAFAALAHADPDPKRKVIVLEFRSGSSALPHISDRVVKAIAKQTSLDVLGTDQARAIYGEHLDQVIVKCQGEADCVARIGQKVGAAEVVLVGVSELGDVILTMQRIDVSDHSVKTRIADSLAAGAQPSDAQLDDYLTRLLAPSDFLRFGVIDIIASEAGAAVSISGQAKGVTPIPSLKVHAPAAYAIKVEKDGFVPFTTQITVAPDSVFKVKAELQRRGHTAWYQHWYVITVAGVLVAGAAGTAIYFATQPSGTMGMGTLTLKGSIQ